jgi:hypothetical protein
MGVVLLVSVAVASVVETAVFNVAVKPVEEGM